MIQFSTILPLAQDFTKKQFLTMLFDTLSNSLQKNLSKDDFLNFSEGELLKKEDDENFQLYDTEDLLSVLIQKEKSGIVYFDTYTLTRKENIFVLFVRVESFRINASVSPFDSNEFQLPLLVRNLFWNECVGSDHNIPVNNRACVLYKNQIGLAEQILNQKTEFFNPIVYISPTSTGSYRISPDELASSLMGVAHVVVESSPPVSEKIKGKISKSVIHPENGGILIILPGKYKYLIDNSVEIDDLKKFIITFIHSRLSDVLVDKNLLFSHVKNNYLVHKLTTNNSCEIYEQMLESQNEEIEQLKSQIAEYKEKLYRSKEALTSYQSSFEKQPISDGFLINCSEPEFYKYECKDVILKLIEKELKSMGSNKQKMSRKYTVLSKILESNQLTGKDQEIIKKLKGICLDGPLNKKKKQELEQLGFSVALGQSGHYKIAFFNDPRYTTVMGSTPSDKAAGENYVSEFGKKLFGY